MGNIGLEPELTREYLAAEYRKACERIAALVALNEGNIVEVSRLRSDLNASVREESARMDEVKALTTQLHDVRNELMVARVELADAQVIRRTVLCVSCGATLLADAAQLTPNMLSEMQAHDRVCPNNPMVKEFADARAENGRLREAAEFYLDERPCFGIGSRMGCCAGPSNLPARRCVHLSEDPNEWCFSGKFMEALGR